MALSAHGLAILEAPFLRFLRIPESEKKASLQKNCEADMNGEFWQVKREKNYEQPDFHGFIKEKGTEDLDDG